jgi:hypothetical protein
MANDKTPLVQEFQARSGAVSAGSDGVISVAEAPFDGTISGVSYIPDVAVTGADTNTRTLSFVNKGQAGSGTVTPATLALVSGVNLGAFVEKDFILSSTASDLVVAQGDIIAFKSQHGGTGIADPGGLVQVEITRG